jgi:ATP-dependent protease Clp ATPase subunit
LPADIGDDVEVCIARLLQAAGFDTELAGVGIVYLDEVDKLAKSDSGPSGEGRTKDVGGLGVQQVRPLPHHTTQSAALTFELPPSAGFASPP